RRHLRVAFPTLPIKWLALPSRCAVRELGPNLVAAPHAACELWPNRRGLSPRQKPVRPSVRQALADVGSAMPFLAAYAAGPPANRPAASCFVAVHLRCAKAVPPVC